MNRRNFIKTSSLIPAIFIPGVASAVLVKDGLIPYPQKMILNQTPWRASDGKISEAANWYGEQLDRAFLEAMSK